MPTRSALRFTDRVGTAEGPRAPWNQPWARRAIALLAAAATTVVLAPPVAAAPADFLADPVLSLAFEENLTDAADPANPVTFKGHMGSATTNYSWVDGVGAGTKALQLGGQTYLDLGSSTDLQPEDLTLSFWLKPNATMTGEQIISWNKQAWNSDGWYLSSEGDSSPLALSIGPAGDQPYKVRVASSDRAAFFPAGQWTHIVVTYDHVTKDVRYFRNGEQVQAIVANAIGGTATGVLGSSPTLPKTIGFNGPQYNGAYLTSALDQYQLFNGVAGLEDVVHLYEQGTDRTIDRAAVAAADADALSLPEQVTLAVVLPSTGSRGSTITWSSSDTDVIDVDGTVTRPAEGEPDAEVTLTAAVTFLDGPTVTREFHVVVPAAQSGGPLEESGMSTVLLSDAYLNNAAAKEHEYLLSLSSEKFLYEFYKVGGLTPTTTSGYAGWERSDQINFRGHAFGHYMSALAMSYSGSSDQATKDGLLAEITAAVDGLEQVQDAYATAHPDSAGYVSAFRESILDQVQGTGGSDENVIVPWYNLHKVLVGLEDIATYAPPAQAAKAKAIAEEFGEYIYRRVSALADKTILLRTEYGGMNDALYRLFDLSGGNPHFKVAAEAFDEVALFRNLAAGQDVLSGRHANTTIPKFIGALKRYTLFSQNPAYYAMLTDQEKTDLPMYLSAAVNFFDIVVQHHTYATGANSQSEHFHGADELYVDAQLRGTAGNALTAETCNEYNMLKLARELLKLTKDVKYANYYENTFINTILASQNPETGMTTYFQPMGPGYHKVFGMPFTEFWCCIGTGMENFSKLGDSMYYTGENSVYVVMFFSSTFENAGKNLRLTQEANLPRSNTVRFTVDSLDGAAVAAGTSLRLRVPDWTAGTPEVKVNGTAVTPAISGGYALLPDIAKGDEITYTLPMAVAAIATPDNENFVAFKYGPVILSAALGTDNITNSEPQGILVRMATFDADAQTVITVNGSVEAWKADLAGNVVRVADVDGDVAFKLQNTSDAAELTFTPHYKRYAESYGLYMNLEEPDSAAAQERIRQVKVQQRTEEFTIDSLTNFDANNAEAEKGMKSANSGVGTFGGRQYRDAQANGWFSYDLQIEADSTKNFLGATYYSGDLGRTFDVYVNDEKLKTVTVTNTAGTNVFYEELTEIPAKFLTVDENTRYKTNSNGEFVLDPDGNRIPVVTVRWQSTGGLVGGLFGVRVVLEQNFDTDPKLAAFAFDTGVLTPAFDPQAADYRLTVPPGTTSVVLNVDPHLPTGMVEVDGILIDDRLPRTVMLSANGTKALHVKGFAQDHTTSKTYTVVIVTAVPDTTAPVTTATVTPASPSGSGGWWNAPATITLAATDAGGVATTQYALGDGVWEVYSGPVPVDVDGAQQVRFRSTDTAGNVEADKTVAVKVDTTAPQIAANADGDDPVTISLVSADRTSGVASMSYRLGAGDWTDYPAPFTVTRTSAAQVVQFRATDVAGNTSTTRQLTVPAAPVVLADSDTKLKLSAATAPFGATVTATVTVTSSATIGREVVSLYDGATLIGAGVLSGGKTTIALDGLAVGPHQLTARFAGNAGAAESSDTEPLVVTRATAAVKLKVSASSQSYGTPKPVTATATVTLNSLRPPAGSVQFRDGATVLATVPVVNGKAVYRLSATAAVGRHSLTARFVPSSSQTTVGATSSAVAVMVTKAASVTKLKADRSSQKKGRTVLLTASVALNTGRPVIGSVRFVVDGRAAATVAAVRGVATWKLPATTKVGKHRVKAQYLPRSTGTVAGSTSSAVVVTITG